jgi:hypothetical protein
MSKKLLTAEVPEEEENETYPLIYNQYFGPVTINAETVIFQTGQPSNPNPKPPGG